MLQGVRFAMPEPAIVALLGRNGSGRSTTLKAMMGWLTPSSGSVRLKGQELAGARAYTRGAARPGLCARGAPRLPQPVGGRERLLLGILPGVADAPRWTIEDMYQYFPRLKERRNQKAGTLLPGGEAADAHDLPLAARQSAGAAGSTSRRKGWPRRSSKWSPR